MRAPDGAERVRIARPARPRENVREAGLDLAAGAVALEEGRELSAHDLALLASLGEARIAVGPRVRAARRRCRQFLAEDITQGRRPDLQGGGLRRSAGGWEGHPALRRGHEGWTSPTSPLGRFGLGAGEGRRAAARPGALEGAASFGETAEKAERVAKLYPAYSEPAN